MDLQVLIGKRSRGITVWESLRIGGCLRDPIDIDARKRD